MMQQPTSVVLRAHPLVVALVVVLFATTFVCSEAGLSGDGSLLYNKYPATDPRLGFLGRWQHQHELRGGADVVARADWPCSGLKFRVTTSPSSTTASSSNNNNNNNSSVIRLRLGLLRVRANVVVTNDATGLVESAVVLEGSTASLWDKEQQFDLKLPHTNSNSYTVSLTKMTQASPYNNGVGKSLTSVLEFHGLETAENVELVTLPEIEFPSRRVAMIGASDTAGFCVDGSPETSDAKIRPWLYDNCDLAYHSVLGRRLNAQTTVQAIAGIGVTQNAFASVPALLGRDTMPEFYRRLLQTQAHPRWDFATEAQTQPPDLVVVSLGGNDFNHQSEVPSEETFSAAYQAFLQSVIDPYLKNTDAGDNTPVAVPTIVSICGQGDPTEVERDPNNDRCRPCPHVQDATEAFARKYKDTSVQVRVEYIFIPCDGTVVTGIDDIGCEGHKNSIGQARVADFLEPRLRHIMGWNDNDDDDDQQAQTTTTTATTRIKAASYDEALAQATIVDQSGHHCCFMAPIAAAALLLMLMVRAIVRCRRRQRQTREPLEPLIRKYSSVTVLESDSDDEDDDDDDYSTDRQSAEFA